MKRRDLLCGGSVALALTVAGCTGGDTEDVEDNSSGNGNGNGNTEDTSTDEENDESTDASNESGGEEPTGSEDNETRSNESEEADAANESEGETDNESEDGGSDESENNGSGGQPQIETTSDELVVEEGEFATNVYADTYVENSGDAASGAITLTADWYDADGNYLDNSTARLETLPAGETWNAHVRYLGTEGGNVDSHEVNGEFATEPIDFNPDGLELVDDELLASEDNVEVRGEVENNTGGEASYIQATATFYNADGGIIGDDWTNVTDVPDGESWSFTVPMLESRRFGEVEDYQVRISDSGW